MSTATMLSAQSANLNALDLQQRGKLVQFVGDMTNADSAMMRGTVNVPFINEPSRSDREAISAVGITNLEDRSRNRFTFGNEQL